MIAAILLATTLAPMSSPPPATQPGAADPAAFVADIEEAHGTADVYYAKPAIEAITKVEFGGSVRLDGPVTYLPAAHVTRIETGDKTIVFDGTTCYVAPADQAGPGDRFAALTWPYFLAAPFKLNDGGVKLADGGMQKLDGDPEPTVALTFDAGTGDAPDDWYLIWKIDDGTMAAMAYIVTYGGREPEPHVIVYDQYTHVDGSMLPTKMTFYNWNAEQGIHGDPIGAVTVSSYKVIEPADDLFNAPAESEEVPLP